ncbi:MAG: translesion error-prone DNA polymerase V autoproteolytic subunit [Spirochaetales bacterium]|nr:translesion error-prone DNA polymerase V autoproteolytic subunit [Spirochaetales bacterium]MCF7937457.1 translesion error-prone DNA polymerase V autoproteolytic subunit [Spirochaetales bacterium]
MEHTSLPCSRVYAGFPSPAEDYVEQRLDISAHLVRRPAATYCMRVTGDSMSEAGVFDGDILLVDRSLNPRSGDIVVAGIDGSFLVKRLQRRGGTYILESCGPGREEYAVNAEEGLYLWGVVTFCIHPLRQQP